MKPWLATLAGLFGSASAADPSPLDLINFGSGRCLSYGKTFAACWRWTGAKKKNRRVKKLRYER